MDEYFRVSNCKNAKEMWDTLQVTHEGTTGCQEMLKQGMATQGNSRY